MSLLALPLGLLVGLTMGALGGGGSVMAVPVLVYLLGETPHQAGTASLLIVAVSSAAGALAHRGAAAVPWRARVGFAGTGALTAGVGSWLSRGLDGRVLLVGFAALMVLAAGAMWLAPSRGAAGGDAVAAPPLRTPRWGRAVAAGLMVGLLTGIFGVGGGFLGVPALVFAADFTMPAAIATSLMAITVNSVAALATRLPGAVVDWGVVLPFAALAVVGALLGQRGARRVSSRLLQRAFAALLVALALLVIVDQLILH